MWKKPLNNRCPLQAECERTCQHIGHELDCRYYEDNAVGEDRTIPDQEERRQAIERRRDEEAFEQALAELEDEEEPAETALVPQTEMKIVRTVDVIAAEIRTLTASMLSNIIEIGRRMVEAKELLPHGEFGPWLKVNTGYSTSKANDYMRIFREYGSPQGSLFGAEVNCQTYGNLNYSQALALLDIPAEEREAFVLEHHVEDMSTRELKQAIKERDEARNELSGMKADMDGLREELQSAQTKADTAVREAKGYDRTVKRLEKELADLKAKPVEVAVEVDQAAIDKAVEEASANLQTQLDAVKEDRAAEIDKLTRHLQTVMAEKEQADQALETANRQLADAQAKLEEAQKPKDTAQQDKELAEFEFYFNQAQETANKLRGMLLKSRSRGDTNTAEKLKKALKALGEAIGRAAE